MLTKVLIIIGLMIFLMDLPALIKIIKEVRNE